MLKKLFLLILMLFTLIACNKKEKQKESEVEKFVVPRTIVSFVDSVEKRNGLAPNFFWKDSSGKLNSFDLVHKKITIVNFWATWCSPCKKEIPDLIEINREFAEKGVRVIGISTDKGVKVQSEVDEFVKENNIDYPIIIDNGKLAEAFGNIRGLPTTFLINENGNIVRKFLGIKPKEFFIEQIEEIIK